MINQTQLPMIAKKIQLSPKITIANDLPMVLMAGMNVIEKTSVNLSVAESLSEICKDLEIPLIFKASFDKANRTRVDSYRGLGMQAGLEMLRQIKAKYDLPILTDVHDCQQVEEVAKVADVIQIPAFLCRQTDLIKAVCETKKPIHLKKMQMLAPEDMQYVIEKCKAFNHDQVILCERGTSFGYHQLIVDPLSFRIMKSFQHPVTFDVTHALQLPGQNQGSSAGRGFYLEDLAKSALIQGIAGIFIEFHPNPSEALCDGQCAYPLSQARNLLSKLKRIDDFAKSLDQQY
jgi:2-dehydro-3-deoxyphosphooctonate aldolase (KDO 8-P synthase)